MNRLVAAASELLAEAVQIRCGAACDDVRELNERLAGAVMRFETRARDGGAQDVELMAGRYVLCCMLDETVLATPWPGRREWLQCGLLRRFYTHDFGGEKFFQLLGQLSRDPARHLSLLELMYLCLSLGFAGKYRAMERGALQLEQVREALYRQVRHVRGDPPPACAPVCVPMPQRRGWQRWWPVAVAAAGVLAGLLLMYSGFAWVLGQQRDTLLHAYQSSAPGLPRTPPDAKSPL